MSSDLDRSILENSPPLASPLLEVAGDGAVNLALSSEVEVQTEQVEGRRRRISARACLPYSSEKIWQILTDYEHLADFIPNLSKSCRTEHPQGGIRIEQIGVQSLWKLQLKFCARVVLDMVENFPHEIGFQMVEGDFKEFYGHWQLHPTQNEVAEPGTNLCYSLTLLPSRMMPISLIESRLKKDLAMNLNAIRQRADQLFEKA